MSDRPIDTSRPWHPPGIIRRRWLRYVLITAAIAYTIAGTQSIDVRWERVVMGMERAGRFFAGFVQPDFVSRGRVIRDGILESLTMTAVSTVIGIVVSIPIALGAARNIAVTPVYLLCRGIITVSRTFQEVIIAIFFVAMFGFGPFAGVMTLSFATIGFLAKLLAEDIEEIDTVQLEAIRATGAGWFQLISYAVQPQVMPRLIGLSLYRLDINFRESAIIGIVGAGGIGAALNTSFSRYEYDTSAAILLIIISIVLMAEHVSGAIRKRVA
jgi:phosphonate transport system permease protein